MHHNPSWVNRHIGAAVLPALLLSRALAQAPGPSPDGQESRPTTKISLALAALEKASEPIPAVERIEWIIQTPEKWNDEQLERVVKASKESRDEAWKKWQGILTLMQVHRDIMQNWIFRTAVLTMKLHGAGQRYEKRLEEIAKREDEAYLRVYPDDNPPSSRLVSRHEEEWRNSHLYKPFDDEKDAAREALIREAEQCKERASKGNPEFQQKADAAIKLALHEYEVSLKGIRTINEEITRRRTGRAAVKQRQAEEEQRLAKLRLRTNASTIDLETGETSEVWFWVEKGLSPYEIRFHVPKTVQMGQRDIPRATSFMIPFRFLKPGSYEAHVEAYDQEGVSKYVKITFNVTGEEIKPGPEPGKQPAEEPKEARPPKKPAGPKPPKSLVGRYRAALHDQLPLVSLAAHSLTQQGRNAPIPFILEIDSAGRITAEVDYEAPAQHLDSKNFDSYYARVRFRIDGHVNPLSGKTRLLIYDVVNRYGGKSKASGDHQQTVIKSEVTVTGWQIPGPQSQTLLNTPIMNVQKHSNMFPWYPKAAKQPDGSFEFTGDGFFGIRGMRGSDELAKYKVQSTVSFFQGKSKDQGTANLQRTSQRDDFVISWYLQILGPAVPPPPPVATGKGALVGFGVYPEGPMRIPVGKELEFTAKGVFANNVFKLEDLTSQAEWQSSDPLLELSKKPATFMSMTPGTYRIRGRIKDQGEWMRDLTTIIVEPLPEK